MKFNCLLFLLTLHLTLYSQDNNAISGYVNEQKGIPIDAATVILHRHTDSIAIKISLTNGDGFFSFEQLKKGTYFFEVSCLGYDRYTSLLVKVDSESVRIMEPIVLTAATKELQTVVVSSEKPLVSRKQDRTILNVSRLLSAQGSTALELIKMAPGVTAGPGGSFSINGKSKVLVTIDGRQTYLSGEALIDYLNGLSSGQFSEVEVINRPSAKYDAEATGGIINLKTKRSATDGVNGSITLSARQGYTFSSVNNLDLSWKKRNWNVSLNYGYISSNPHSDDNSKTILRNINDMEEAIMEGFMIQQAAVISNNLRTGIGYSANNTNLALEYKINIRSTPSYFARGITNIWYPRNGESAVNKSESWKDVPLNNQAANIYIDQKLNKDGAHIQLLADYLRNRPVRTYELVNTSYPQTRPQDEDIERIRYHFPAVSDVFGARLDFIYPFSKALKLETGLKSTFMRMDNNAAYERYNIAGGGYIPDEEKSKHYLYYEDIHAFYISADHHINDHWEWDAGLRAEYTRNKGEAKFSLANFGNDFLQFFPSLSLNYNSDESFLLTASYHRRINRPKFDNLIPVTYFTNLLQSEEGNPLLSPEYSSEFNLSGNFFDKFTITGSFLRLKDAIVNTDRRDQSGIAIIWGYDNFDRIDTYGFSVDYNDEPAKWFTYNLNATLNYNHFSGIIYDELFDTRGMLLEAQALGQFQFLKNWSAELTGTYFSRNRSAPFIIEKASGSVNIAIGKKILKDKGSLRFQVADLFKTDKIRAHDHFRSLDMWYEQNRFTHFVGLSFSYRFGNAKKVSRQSKSSTDEVSQRF